MSAVQGTAGERRWLQKERPTVKEIGRRVAIGIGMRPEQRQRHLSLHEVDEPSVGADRTDALVALRSVSADTVRLADGSLRAVLECPTLPVSASHGERSWLATLSRLLDRLDHPFQLVIQRRCRADAGRATREDVLSRLRDSYERLLAERWPDRPLRRRRLFVVVSSPADADERGPIDALEKQVRDARELLGGAGIETGRVPAGPLAALVAVTDFAELRSEVRLDGRLAQPLRVEACPTLMSADWLAALRATDADLDISVHLRAPVLAGGELRAFAAVLVTVWADDRARLDEASGAVERVLAERLVRIHRVAFEAEPAFISALPLGILDASAWRCLSLRTLSSLLRSGWSGDADRGRGLLFGVEPGSRRPLLLDRQALTDRSTFVLGSADADRLSVLKVEVARARVAGAAVVAIDMLGELAPFVGALGGAVVRLDPKADAPLDAFTVTPGQPGALSSRIACLMAVIELLANGLSDHQSWALEHALSYVFALRGYTDDGDAARLAPPLASEVTSALGSQSERAFGEVKAQIDALARVLSSPDGRWLLASAGGSAPRTPLLAYDLSGVPENGRPAATLLALDNACAPASDVNGGRLVVVDEVTPLSRLPHAAAHLVRLVEAGASERTGLRLATADVAGLLTGPARRFVADPHLKLLLRQAPDAMPALAELLHLTPAEQSRLLAARPAEGLLMTPDQRLAFELVMTDGERRLITGGMTR